MTIDIPAQEPTDEAYQQFIAALRRSNAETEKFISERQKLDAEARKLRWGPVLMAFTAAAGTLAAGAALAGVFMHFAR